MYNENYELPDNITNFVHLEPILCQSKLNSCIKHGAIL